MSIESKAEQPRATVAKAIEAAHAIIAGMQDNREYCSEAGKERDDALYLIRSSFIKFCAQTGIKPRNMHDVWNDDSYTGTVFIEDYEHNISSDEMEAWLTQFAPK